MAVIWSMLMAATAAAPLAAPAQKYSVAYEKCMAMSGGVTVAMRDCSSTEYRRLDADLNRRYRALMKTLPKPKADSLRMAERRWIVERKRKCDAAGGEAAGGTLELVLVDACYLEALNARVGVLAAMQRR